MLRFDTIQKIKDHIAKLNSGELDGFHMDHVDFDGAVQFADEINGIIEECELQNEIEENKPKRGVPILGNLVQIHFGHSPNRGSFKDLTKGKS